MSIDMNVVARYAAGGGLTGVSIGSVVNLARHISMMRREEERRKKREDTDADTIVLTLPRKVKAAAASKPKSAAAYRPGVKLDKSVASGKTFPINRNGQSRTDDGKFAMKVSINDETGPKPDNTVCANSDAAAAGDVDMDKCAAGWQTMTVATLAALTSLYAGVSGANAVYDAANRKRLKREVDDARQEYLDALQSGAKIASADTYGQIGTDLLLGSVPSALHGMEKSADPESLTFGALQYPLAAFAVLSALGSGSTAYVTKKVLDEQFDEALDEGYDAPKVKRIVFKMAPETDEETEKRSEYEIKESENNKIVALATIAVFNDCMSGVPRFTSIPQFKAAMDRTELGYDGFMKAAARQLASLADNEKTAQATGTPATAPAAPAPAATAAPVATANPAFDVPTFFDSMLGPNATPEDRKAFQLVARRAVAHSDMHPVRRALLNAGISGLDTQAGRWAAKKFMSNEPLFADIGNHVNSLFQNNGGVIPLIEKGYNFVSPLLNFLMSMYAKAKGYAGQAGRFVNEQLANYLGYKVTKASADFDGSYASSQASANSQYTPGMAQFAEKIAATPLTTILAGFGGGQLLDLGPERQAKLLAKELERERAKRRKEDEDDGDSASTASRVIRIAAEDPAAAKFVSGNIDKIKKLVARLSAQGTI